MKKQNISIRKFPYPYRAAFSICSDIDNSTSVEMYLAVMEYLNTYNNTCFGKGLGIETGNSFWFFNNTDTRQLSYFGESGIKETEFTPYCRQLLNSGHIDVLHTYGNFDQGGFTRRHAEVSLNELEKLGVKITVWVNHGSNSNRQNIGSFLYLNGANPLKDEYHTDLLTEYGVRYAWLGRLTHILGQDSRNTINVVAKNFLQKVLFNTKYRHIKEDLFDPSNRLMIETELQDHRKIWDFQRWVNAWGKENTLDIFDLCSQLVPANIDTLIKNEGFLIVYSHIGEGLHFDKQFPFELKKDLEHISRMHKSGQLFVTTTSRLLNYKEMTDCLNWEIIQENEQAVIEIQPSFVSLGKTLELKTDSLQGLTFYCQNSKNISVKFNETEIPVIKNHPDHTGRMSVSIPWKKLEFPQM